MVRCFELYCRKELWDGRPTSCRILLPIAGPGRGQALLTTGCIMLTSTLDQPEYLVIKYHRIVCLKDVPLCPLAINKTIMLR